MARPTRKEAVLISQRNKKIKSMAQKYPVGYVAEYFNLSKGRVSRILSDIDEVTSGSKKNAK